MNSSAAMLMPRDTWSDLTQIGGHSLDWRTKLREQAALHHMITTGVIRRPSRNETSIIYVLSTEEVYPYNSIREIARDTNLSTGIVYNILKDHWMRAYHIALHQALAPEKAQKQLRFCHWAQRTIVENQSLFSNVLWPFKSIFSSTGVVNRNNSHYWSDLNSNWMRLVDDQYRFSINVRCSIFCGRVIGPHFFEDQLSGKRLTTFLNNKFMKLLQDIPLN